MMRRSTSRRSTALILVGILCLYLIAISSSGQETDGSNGEQSSDNEPNRRSSGIFNMIFSPLRVTMEHAKRLLGHRLEGASEIVADGFSKIQVQTFKLFMNLYNKTYSPDEIPKRMALFFERREAIQQSVKEFAEGRLSFVMRENPFIDWDETELKALTGVSPPKSYDEMTEEERQVVDEIRHQEETSSMTNTNQLAVTRPFYQLYDDQQMDEANLTVMATEKIPATKDWRTSGCVATPINQLKCGACYAIATMGVVESMRCINQVSSPILAPQQVVDCATSRAGYQNYGCDGGWPTRVLKYLQDVKIAARESCYPFVRRQLQCRLNKVRSVSGCTVSASPSGTSLRYKVLNNERDILYHVAKTGPVVTVMKATDKFLYYGSGIFDDPKCSRKRDDVDHAIVIVGYGRENGQDYWLIKNSWGTTDWGEGGYGKYKRGTYACSIGHWGWVVTG